MNNRQAKTQPTPSKSRFSWTWLGILLPIAAVVALVIAGQGTDGSTTPEVEAGTKAALFELPATDGSTMSLSNALLNGDVVVYFSMGVGCDGCFAQIPEVADAMAERNITMLSVMVQPADIVGATADAWGITTPILIDEDQSVSRAYNMIGKNGHNDRPFHSIAVVRQDGTLVFEKTYDSMFVPAAEFMADVDSALS